MFRVAKDQSTLSVLTVESTLIENMFFSLRIIQVAWNPLIHGFKMPIKMQLWVHTFSVNGGVWRESINTISSFIERHLCNSSFAYHIF